MDEDSFKNLCLFDTLAGLQDGVSHFSGPSRVALIYAEKPESPLLIYDPQNLLQGHEPKFKELYVDSDLWRTRGPDLSGDGIYSFTHQEKNLGLAGLISQGARSRSLFYQMWFTEHHPDMCSVGPTERWLEHAAVRLSHDFANQMDLYTGISGRFLQEYATHAVRDYIVDEMNIILGWDTPLRIYPILEAVIGISGTSEEGVWPRGEVVFVESSSIQQLSFMAKFPFREQPKIANFKHVRKLLLSVENSDRRLVSDGRMIVGIATQAVDFFCISVMFKRGHGFLKVNDHLVCSFSSGSFHSTTNRAKLFEVEEILLESPMDADIRSQLFKIISAIVHYGEEEEFGCTLVVDMDEVPLELPGQRFEESLDLREERYLELAQAMARVDGALHIGADLHLHGFACLLDGHAIPGEDRSRGARFNSALRFSAEHEKIFVVVVSVDRPVSVIQGGVQLSAQCEVKPLSGSLVAPCEIEAWLNRQEEL
jgi:hypothetical protein